MLAALAMNPTVVAVETSWRRRVSPEASVPIVQIPVAGSYVPRSAVASVSVSPAGKTSVTVTPDAASGPLLAAVITKLTESPTVALLSGRAILPTERSREWRRDVEVRRRNVVRRVRVGGCDRRERRGVDDEPRRRARDRDRHRGARPDGEVPDRPDARAGVVRAVAGGAHEGRCRSASGRAR